MSTSTNTAREDAFAKRFPDKIGVVGTHFENCHYAHPECAWHAGYDDGLASALDDATDLHRAHKAEQDDHDAAREALAGCVDTLRMMRKREKALQWLLVSFRTGSNPPQWVFDHLGTTKSTPEIADALIARHQ